MSNVVNDYLLFFFEGDTTVSRSARRSVQTSCTAEAIVRAGTAAGPAAEGRVPETNSTKKKGGKAARGSYPSKERA